MPKVEIDLPEAPEGYEYTGQYRTPLAGDLYVKGLGVNLVVLQATGMAPSPCFIVRKKRWKPVNTGYYFITSRGEISRTFCAVPTVGDKERFDFYNCFRTHHLAETARGIVLKTLKELPHE